ncbi:MAG: hypothetical protein HC918_14990 [Oscillatoriales cyanobacterium SM2_1_8]|nr:hypothetical protein [Oscillatoriales cyanobacterium SM2_1_8]
MKTVGVLGGGQLAWMLAIAAEELGVPLVVWTDEAQAAVKQMPSARVVKSVGALLSQVDACLFENEWADFTPLPESNPEFLPDLGTLAAMVDKYQQRQTMQALGLPTPDFRAIHTAEEVGQAGQALGYPWC